MKWFNDIAKGVQNQINNNLQKIGEEAGQDLSHLMLKDEVMRVGVPAFNDNDPILVSCSGNKKLYPKPTSEHQLIQNDFIKRFDEAYDVYREYYIANASGNSSINDGRADIVALKEGGIYELKYIKELSQAREQVGRYVDFANQNCSAVAEWVLGEIPYAAIFWDKSQPHVIDITKYPDVIAYLIEPGIIVYFSNDGKKYIDPVSVLNIKDVPKDNRVIEKLKEIVREQYPDLQVQPNINIDFDILWDMLIKIGIGVIAIIAIIIAIKASMGVGAVVAILLAVGMSESDIRDLLGIDIAPYL